MAKARRFFNRWLRFGYWLLLRLQMDGVENIPFQGPVILMINHIHFLDPFVVVASTPRLATAMSKIENFSIPFWGWIFKLYGAIPVRRGQVDRRALKQALDVLKGGQMLLLAPEGTRSPYRALQPAHNGLAYIAHRSNAVIVPVAITGTPNFSRNLKRLRRTPVHIKLGKPFYLRTDSRRLKRETLNAMTTEAMYQLAALLPPEHRGFYSDLEQATENHVHFLDSSDSNLPLPRPRGELREELSEAAEV
jgi:1-acyl-sn-glycerol-3-phosphate acyltransferase